MKKLFITSVSEQKNLTAAKYESEIENLSVSYKTPYPIFNVIENECTPDDECTLLAIKLPGEYFEKNYEMLCKCVKEFTERSGIKIDVVLVKRELSETPDAYSNLFKAVVNEIPDNSRIFTDITYGTKPLVPVLFSVLTYAYRLKFNIDVAKIVYGKYEWQTEKGYIYDITQLFYINFLVEDIANSGGENPQKAAEILFGI